MACIAAVVVLVCVYAAGFYSRGSRPGTSWGRFGGNCFEVVETGEPGCLPSYTDDTTLTLSVH